MQNHTCCSPWLLNFGRTCINDTGNAVKTKGKGGLSKLYNGKLHNFYCSLTLYISILLEFRPYQSAEF